MNLAAWWESLGSWSVPIEVVAIIIGAVIVRLILGAVVRVAVRRIVNRAKAKQGTQDTQEMQSSPLAAVRVVQRT